MTVQRRMFIGLLSAIVVFVIAINLIIQTLLQDIAEREILIGLENAVVAYSRFDEQRQELLLTRAKSFAQTAHLTATLAIPNVDAETIRVAGQYLEGTSTLDILLILSDSGELMADVNDINVPASELDFGSGIQQALTGESYVGLWKKNDALYELAIVPLVSNYQILGLLAAGQRIDSSVASRLATDISGTNVTWLHNQTEQPSNVRPDGEDNSPADIDGVGHISRTGDLIRHIAGARLERLSHDDGLLFKATIFYPSLRTALVFHQELDLDASGVGTVRRFVLICSLIVILLSMALCFWISSRISRPIVQLTEVTRDFGKGKFDVRLQPASKDEIGDLTVAFNAMAEEIVENRQDLLTSLDAAEAANRAKSEFLARMSHEIRTPMNGVLGMAELLLNSDITEQQRECALTILDSGDGLMTIINDVLDFSKIEAGKLELNITQFSVHDAVAETAALLIHHAESKGLRLITPFRRNEDLWVSGDKLRFKQILTNLVGNAVKFTQNGCVSIRIATVDGANNDVTIKIEVTDTGVGIQTEDLTRIFDLFTQVDGTDSRRFGGTGLGLAISKDLLGLMGGQIGASSKIGEGSTFWFQLTFDKASGQHAPQEAKGASESAFLSDTDLPVSLSVRSVEPLQRPAKILLVEDNAANQKVALTMLRMLGCETDVAEDGQKGLARAQGQFYDVILMDCQMPIMDGFAATAAIREWERQRRAESPVPIIAVTANALVTDREQCLAAGMSDYLSKPFRLADLKAGIGRWLPTEPATTNLTPNSNSAAIGSSELDELRELGASMSELEEIVACYIETSTESIDEMAAAVKLQDRESLRSLAHKLKGGSNQVGALEVANVCLELNAEATEASWETLERILVGLEQKITATNEALSALWLPEGTEQLAERKSLNTGS